MASGNIPWYKHVTKNNNMDLLWTAFINRSPNVDFDKVWADAIQLLSYLELIVNTGKGFIHSAIHLRQNTVEFVEEKLALQSPFTHP